ncbi:MAG: ABC transporter permease [Streptomyces sp.]|uniref:ABC transporter permease n=1 Tax=Streptomyces sp. TaxID=1931 RepID=UPI0025DAC259|nr:ABC transporter permease [Streptomyces sp.]MBW8797563.1 ABC transporter permease [Streptomyces sp.]
MSTLTSSTPGVRRGPGPRLRGLTWLIWRQNRTAFWIALAAAAAVAVYAAVQHQHVAAAVSAHHLDACHGRETSAGCLRNLLGFERDHQFPLRRPLQAMLLLPFLFGLFLGGPQLAQELESGTYRTVATQSVTRTRWFAAKLGVPLVMTVFVSGVFSAAMTWWWHPVAGVLGPLFPWQGWYPFYGVGPVVVGLCVLLYLLGATLGLVLRRTVLAMGATLVVGAGLFALLEQVRPYLWPVRTASAQHTSEPPAPGSAWMLADGPLSKDGRRVSEVTDCYAQSDFRRCLTGHGITGHWAEYHPASDFWPLQWTATGVCLALGVALVALSLWWIRRHPS